MTTGASAKAVTAAKPTFTRQEVQDQVIAILRSELPDKSVEVTMDTRSDAIEIDSLTVIQTVFKVEEAFGIEVEVSSDASFETVGDLVAKLIESFPPGRLVD